MFVEAPFTDEKGNRRYRTVNTDLIRFIEDADIEYPNAYYSPQKSVLVFTDGTRQIADDSRYWMTQRFNKEA